MDNAKKTMLDSVDLMIKTLLEDELIYDADKDSIFAVAQKLARVFGDEIVGKSAEAVAIKTIGKAAYYGGKPLKYYMGWLRNEVQERRADETQSSAPIEDLATQITVCKLLDTEALRRILLSDIYRIRINIGKFTFHPTTTQEEACKIKQFYKGVLHEWEFINNNLLRMSVLDQNKAFKQYNNYRAKSMGWLRHKKAYEKLINKLSQQYAIKYLQKEEETEHECGP
jgi:hypothetical protein